MKKFNETVHKLVFPVLCDYTVHVIFSNDPARSRNKRDAILGEFEEEFFALHSYTTKDAISYLFFPKNPPIDCIAHESWHCVLRMMTWAGIGLDNETFAYHIGYLVSRVCKFSKWKNDGRRLKSS